MADANQRVKKIDVGDQFHLSPGRQLLLPLIPLVAAVLVVWLVSPAVVEEEPQVNAAAIKKQVRLASEGLKSKLIEKRKQAEKKGLKDMKALLRTGSRKKRMIYRAAAKPARTPWSNSMT